MNFAQKPVPFLKKNGKYIYVDSSTMRPIITMEYDLAFEFQSNVAIVSNNKHFGIINVSGVELTKLKYDGIEKFDSGFARIFINDSTVKYQWEKDSERHFESKKWGLLDLHGNEVVPTIYAHLSPLNNGMLQCSLREKNYRTGFIDRTNKIVIPIIYREAELLKNGLIKVSDDNGKYGIIDKYGKKIVEFKYNEILDFENGLAQVILGENYYKQKKGWINKNGEIIIPVNYLVSETDCFENKYIFYNYAGDEKPNFFVHSDYLNPSDFYKNVGYIDTALKEVMQLNFGNYTYGKYDSGLFWARTEASKSSLIIDKTGKILIPPSTYYEIGSFRNGLSVVMGPKFVGHYMGKGIINKAGKFIVPMNYNSIGYPVNGMAAVGIYVGINGDYMLSKNGFVDIISGKLVIPLIYDEVEDFEMGLAKVKRFGKYGLISKTGRIKVPLKYDKIETKTVIRRNNIYTYDNYMHYPVTETEEYFKAGIVKVILKNKVGFVNTEGTEIIPIIYDGAEMQESGLVGAIKKAKEGFRKFFIDKKGREYTEK